jgi:uncharacterized protein (DUF2147 family)
MHKLAGRLCMSAVFGCLLMLAAPDPVRAADADMSPIGTWLTERGGAKIEIANCGSKLCGSIVWLKAPLDAQGRPKLDSRNPDESLRSRNMIGLPLLSDFVRSGDGSNVWQDGRIYDPDDGKTYKCTLTLVDDHTLNVHGYVGISLFGKTQTWTRAEATGTARGK